MEQVREFLLRILIGIIDAILSGANGTAPTKDTSYIPLKLPTELQVLIQVSLILETHTLMLLNGRQRLRILQKDLTRTLLSIQATEKLVRL